MKIMTKYEKILELYNNSLNMLDEYGLSKAFHYLMTTKYNWGIWIPDTMADDHSATATGVHLMEEAVEVEQATYHGTDSELIEELGDYYGLLHPLLVDLRVREEPKISIDFYVDVFNVIIRLSKGVRFGFVSLNEEDFRLFQHFYLSRFGKRFYLYQYFTMHNMDYVIKSSSFMKAIYRLWRDQKVSDNFPDLKHLLGRVRSSIIAGGSNILSKRALQDLDHYLDGLIYKILFKRWRQG